MVGLLVVPVYAAPKKVALKSASGGVLVFQRDGKLEAIRDGQKKPVVLRDAFLSHRLFGDFDASWNFSPSGDKVAFASTPSDVEFFSAAAYRQYLWVAPFNEEQKVLLAAYGKYATKDSYSFDSPSWSFNGKRLAVSQVASHDDPEEVAVYDANTRKEIWSSRTESPKLFPHDFGNTPATRNVWRDIFSPSLSPDGNDLVCFTIGMEGGGYHGRLPDKAPPITVVHFDLKHHTGEVIASLADDLSLTDHQKLRTQCVWHPTQKRVLFVGPASAAGRPLGLFSFDLKTKILKRLTNNKEDNFSPQWSLDGKQIWWIRGNGFSVFQDGANSASPSANLNRIFRSNADGSNPTPILPQLRGVTRIQLLPKIADWSRYRKLSIEPLAGKDK